MGRDYTRDRLLASADKGHEPGGGQHPVVAPEAKLAGMVGNACMGRLLRSATSAEATEAPAGFADTLASASSGGQQLPDNRRAELEVGLGTSLAEVRVHTGATAARLATQVNARAFTVGQDIYFGSGQYRPDSQDGYRLLAHEATHTIQQSGAPATGDLTVSTPNAPAEREAEQIASKLTEGHTDLAPASHSHAVHRFVGPEHESLGNATGANVDLGNNVILTWGQIVGLAGDQYGSVEELQAAVQTADGRARLRHRMEHAELKGEIPWGLEKPTGDQAGNARYVELAMNNVDHFAGGGNAIQTWRTHHDNALLTAALSGLTDDYDSWQRAQLTEAFGQHFLTDSFSSGHVRTPRAEIMAWYQGEFAARAVPPLLAYLKKQLTTALAKDLGGRAGQYLTTALEYAVPIAESLFEPQLNAMCGLGISGAVSGTLHDHDNEHGLWVSSDSHPEPWLTYGDHLLSASPVSRDQAQLAVTAAREQVTALRELGKTRRAETGRKPPLIGSGESATPADAAWAKQAIAQRFPTYQAVEQYVPHEVPGANAAQQNWKWGSFSSTMAAEVDAWISTYVGGFRPAVASIPDYELPADLGTIKVSGHLLSIVDDMLKSPTLFVGKVIGIPSGATASVPGSKSSSAPPKP